MKLIMVEIWLLFRYHNPYHSLILIRLQSDELSNWVLSPKIRTLRSSKVPNGTDKIRIFFHFVYFFMSGFNFSLLLFNNSLGTLTFSCDWLW